jgi:SAM-dependent methyltransferase
LKRVNRRGAPLKPDYGNWITRKFLYAPGIGAVLSLPLSVLLPFFFARLIFGAATVIFLSILLYFFMSRRAFSYEGGKLSDRLLDEVLCYAKWDGAGRVLDIGCGNGALALKLAKKFPVAEIDAVDSWGKEWDYEKKQCEQNAILEGVGDRVFFQMANAAKLPFPDEFFDLVASNFCFHEVKDESNKLKLVREALRVLKKSGVFVFHDLFYTEKYYGKSDDLLTELRTDELTNIDLKRTSHLDFVPRYMRIPFMLGDIGILYGKK